MSYYSFKNIIYSLIQTIYKNTHKLRKVLLPNFNAKDHKIILKVIGKIMNLKLNKVKTNIGISLYLDPLDSLALSYNRIYEPKETFLIQKTVKQGMRILILEQI